MWYSRFSTLNVSINEQKKTEPTRFSHPMYRVNRFVETVNSLNYSVNIFIEDILLG